MKRNMLGFVMLDLFLALVIIAIATFAVYRLYDTTQSNYSHSVAIQEIKDINNNFLALYANHLTDSIKDQDSFISTMYSSNQLSSNYFSTDANTKQQIINAFGVFTVTNASSSSATMIIPMGSTDKNIRQGYCDNLGKEIICKPDDGDSVSTITVTLQVGG
jgi:Tfp pilus assembly protein PilE